MAAAPPTDVHMLRPCWLRAGIGELRGAAPSASLQTQAASPPDASADAGAADDAAAQASYLRALAEWNAQQAALQAAVRQRICSCEDAARKHALRRR